MSKEYKSPPHKLVKFFKESRDAWEKTAKERRKEIRDLQARVRDLEASRALWKEKAKTALEQTQAKEEALSSLQNELAVLKANESALQYECEEYKKKLKHLLIDQKGTAIRLPLSV
jgi:chromosome segregation ATPase